MKKMALFLAVATALFVGCNDPLDVNANVKIMKCNNEEMLKSVERQFRKKEGMPDATFEFQYIITEGINKESRWVTCFANVKRTFTNGNTKEGFEFYQARYTDDGIGYVTRIGKF